MGAHVDRDRTLEMVAALPDDSAPVHVVIWNWDDLAPTRIDPSEGFTGGGTCGACEVLRLGRVGEVEGVAAGSGVCSPHCLRQSVDVSEG